MSESPDVALAIDVGGTGIKAALVDPVGEIHLALRRPTGAERGPDAVVATILDVAADLAELAQAQALTAVAAGVVVPAVINEADGIAEWSANLGLRDVPLRDLVAERIGLPTVLGHDVRAGALAEARLGAGRSTRRMLFVAIGTGIAGGFVLDGRIDSGAHGAAGEIGHVVVRTGPDARPCGCGNRGCLEAYASAAAIGRTYTAAVRATGAGNPVNGPAGTGGEVTAAEVAARVVAGEELATTIWQDAIEVLADGLLTGIALFDPRVIVLGGGLGGAGEILFEPLAEALQQRRTFHRIPELLPAELGDEAGCQGAALLALDLIGAAE
jgi:glucokinase